MTPCLQVYKHLWHLLRGLAGKGKTQVHTSFLKKRKKGSRKKERLKKKSAMQSKIYESLCLPTRGVSYAVVDVVYFSMEKELFYWSVYQYNNVQKSDRLSGKDRKGVLCCQMAILCHDHHFSCNVLFCSQIKTKKEWKHQRHSLYTVLSHSGMWPSKMTKYNFGFIGVRYRSSFYWICTQ